MSLKIYFCGSMRGGQQDLAIYANLIQHLRTYGKVLTEQVGKKDGVETEKKVGGKRTHDLCMEWQAEMDVLIAEVTQPSLGVGYEIGRAINLNIPILCLYRPSPDKKLSAMIDGAHNGDSFIVKHYANEEAIGIIDEFLSRFNSTGAGTLQAESL